MTRRRRTVVDPQDEPLRDPPDDGLPGDDDADVLLPDPGDLAALADASYAEWKWQVYRVRSPKEMAAAGSREQTVWALTLTGPLDVAQLRETLGGGVFRVWGYVGGALRLKRTFELEGPPRYYTPPAPAPPPAAAPQASPSAPNGTDPILLELVRNQQKTLDAIAARLAAPPPAAPGLSFQDALAMAELMGGRGGGVDMKDLVALFKQGIDVGSTAVGGNEKSTLEVILEKAMPSLERVAVAMSARAKARPAGTPPPRKREPSVAAVIEDPAAPAPAAAPAPGLSPEAQQAAVRWGGAVDALARAIEDGTDPADFAGTLDHLLLPEEIDLMLAGGVPNVLEQIRTAGDRYPILLTPPAEQFVGAVLAELEGPDEQEPEKPTP